jgi:hypothetical protein
MSGTNNRSMPLVGHTTCAIKVTSKPTTGGTNSATFNKNGGVVVWVRSISRAKASKWHIRKAKCLRLSIA